MSDPSAKKPVKVPPDDGSAETARWYALEGTLWTDVEEIAELHETERIRTSCGLCGDSFEGPFRDGRGWFAEHRASRHL